MKFYPVKTLIEDSASLEEDYRSARAFGLLRAGSSGIFFRVRLKTYYIPYSDIRRAFRRVMSVPARMCCGRGNFEIEHLVVCDEEKELAVIQLPDTKAARILMELLREKMPDASFAAPKKDDKENGNALPKSSAGTKEDKA